jgi:hypothetical protein
LWVLRFALGIGVVILLDSDQSSAHDRQQRHNRWWSAQIRRWARQQLLPSSLDPAAPLAEVA